MKIKNKKQLFLGFLAVAMLLAAFSPFPKNSVQAEDSTEEIKDSIDNLEKKLEKEQSAKAQLELQLSQIQNSVYSTQAQIDKARALIKESEENIARMEEEVKQMNSRIDLQKEILKDLILEVYIKKTEPIFSMAIFKGDFSRIFGRVDNFVAIEEKILQVSQEIKKTKEKVKSEQEKIAEAKTDHEELLKDKVVQQYDLLEDRNEKQGDIAEKEATIAELQAKLANLQSGLYALTGESFNAKNIQEAIEIASDYTNVPKGVLYGFLDQETSFNKNTGQCTYDGMEEKAVAAYKRYKKLHGSPYGNWNYNTSISTLTKRKGLFEDLVEKLGYSENKKVSCAIIPADFSRYRPNQGGAMGVAQFMSDTWLNDDLQREIRSATGHKTPDPWDLTDGVMALAIKVRNAGATSDSKAAIRKAVINYYGEFSQGYYDNVVDWSKNYKRLFQQI